MSPKFICIVVCLVLFLFTQGCKDKNNNTIAEPEPQDPDPEILEPCSSRAINYPVSLSSDPDPSIESNDLTIGWTSRLPRLEYVWGSSQPEIDGWPAAGQQVIWRAYVKNWSDTVKYNIGYRWLLNKVLVDSGRIELPPGSHSTVDYPWNWTFNRHELTFCIDTDHGTDNKLTVYTDAISLGLYVEQGFYDYFHEHQFKLGIGSNSFEGWAQRQIRFYHELFKWAIYPDAPQGVLDRIRIDQITIVPDESLPLVDPGGNAGFDSRQAIPNLHDRTVDLQWGFPTALTQTSLYSNHSSLNFNNQFYYSGFLQHELGHARYLIDVYGFDLVHGLSVVNITENGQLIAGTAYLPGTIVMVNGIEGLEVYQTIEIGLMNSQWRWMDRYGAVTLNLIAGHRATTGNYNGTENEGIFLNDLPHENRFKIKDSSGKLLKNALIKIYQSTQNSQSSNAAYPKFFDDIPDLVLQTDENAQVLLGQNPFSLTGQIEHEWGVFSNVIFIMRVESERRVGYTIIDVSRFNLEYWRGNTELADYEVCVPLY